MSGFIPGQSLPGIDLLLLGPSGNLVSRLTDSDGSGVFRASAESVPDRLGNPNPTGDLTLQLVNEVWEIRDDSQLLWTLEDPLVGDTPGTPYGFYVAASGQWDDVEALRTDSASGIVREISALAAPVAPLPITPESSASTPPTAPIPIIP